MARRITFVGLSSVFGSAYMVQMTRANKFGISYSGGKKKENVCLKNNISILNLMLMFSLVMAGQNLDCKQHCCYLISIYLHNPSEKTIDLASIEF